MRLLGLGGTSDLRLWNLAVAEGCVHVTKDEDFVKLSVLRGPPPNTPTRATRPVIGSATGELLDGQTRLFQM